jgi:hypothetical protein
MTMSNTRPSSTILSTITKKGEAMYGPNWQSAMARFLNVSDRTVRRWVSGTSGVPDWVLTALSKAPGANHDEWILGEGSGGREYIIHAKSPKFIARLSENEKDADTKTGTVYQIGRLVLCEVNWIDAPPPNDQIDTLMNNLEKVLIRWNE